jgi:hypothetical protein
LKGSIVSKKKLLSNQIFADCGDDGNMANEYQGNS